MIQWNCSYVSVMPQRLLPSTQTTPIIDIQLTLTPEVITGLFRWAWDGLRRCDLLNHAYYLALKAFNASKALLLKGDVQTGSSISQVDPGREKLLKTTRITNDWEELGLICKDRSQSLIMLVMFQQRGCWLACLFNSTWVAFPLMVRGKARGLCFDLLRRKRPLGKQRTCS